MKNAVFWDVTPCGSCKNRHLFLRSVLRLLVAANVVPGLPILVAVMMEAIRYSEASALSRATRRNFQKTPFFISLIDRIANGAIRVKVGNGDRRMTGSGRTANDVQMDDCRHARRVCRLELRRRRARQTSPHMEG
jgi:hypothetical protein